MDTCTVYEVRGKSSIIEIVKHLTASEREELIKLLNEHAIADKIAVVAKTVYQNRQVECPHCHSTDIYGHG